MKRTRQVDWTGKLAEIDRLIAGSHYKQAVQEIGGVLEELLRELYQTLSLDLPAAEQAVVSEKLEKIGKNRSIERLTLGELVGLFREANLFERCEAARQEKLPYLRGANFPAFIDLRNRATHKGASVNPDEAQFYAAQVRLFVRESGLLEGAAGDFGTLPAQGAVRPWLENVSLHQDVLSEGFSEDIFALDLGPLSDGNPNVPAVYRDPEHFFRSSYLTAGLRGLLEDVLSRLDGSAGGRVIKLVTPFGGGKSHTLAGLYHAARQPEALNAIPEGKGFPRPSNTRTAVFDGQFFDATNGKTIPGKGHRARTMWGWIAWDLGGEKGYELLRAQDEARVAPGGDEILAVLGENANLILLDEVLQYLISAGGVRIEQTTLRDETLTFLQRLTSAVGNTARTALVFSLQSSKRESLEYAGLLQMVDHLAARKDQRREPVEGNEILAVIQRRLLGNTPDLTIGGPASAAYQETVTQMRRAYASTTAERQQAEEEGIALRDRMRASYPFHPALIDLMRERWAAIPDFQRTRGALRFLASCLRACHREGKSRAVLGPGDVPLHDPEVRLAFFKEVGQQADFQPVLEHDLTGSNARARRIDDRRAKENPADAMRRPATRLATAILLYSFGGLRREGGASGELLPPGISETELLSVCVGPDLDSTTALACLKELKDNCLYLHFDSVRYCFKKDPNVTLLLEQEAEGVGRDERRVRDRIKETLEARLGGHREAIIWPEKSVDVDDREPSFILAYMPLEFSGKTRTDQKTTALEFFEKCGDQRRQYRNGLALAVPSPDQIETLRRAVRYLIAAEQVKAKAKQFNLTDEQRSQLREREATDQSGAESAILKLYAEVWFPRADGDGIGVEKIAAGGRPLQTTLNAKKQAMIHERLAELITSVQPRVFPSVTPTKIVELFKLGEGQPPAVGIRTSEVLDGFYSFLGFTRLTSSSAVRKGVARGVAESVFAYTVGSPPSLGSDGRYELPVAKVRFGVVVAEDEIDLETGFIMTPGARPVEPVPSESTHTVPTTTVPYEPPDATSPTTSQPASRETRVDLSFTGDRDQLFKAWPAVANLADMAGQVEVTVHAESTEGFDRSKLQNGVLEPLREADLIK